MSSRPEVSSPPSVCPPFPNPLAFGEETRVLCGDAIGERAARGGEYGVAEGTEGAVITGGALVEGAVMTGAGGCGARCLPSSSSSPPSLLISSSPSPS